MVEHHPVILELLDQSRQQLESLLNSKNYQHTLLPLLAQKIQLIHKQIRQYIHTEHVYFFPYLKKQPKVALHDDDISLNDHLLQTMQHKHDVIMKVLQHQRKIVNNYMIKKDWDAEFKSFINHLFLLEKKIENWLMLEQNNIYPFLTKAAK
jgi:iron-sulfur cluster repair protein YtfE (RIC family)